MKPPQLMFSLDADLLFPCKYIAKVLVAEKGQREVARQKKKEEDRQWISNWYQQHQQQQQSETPWYKTFFRGENAQSVTTIHEIGNDEEVGSSWTGNQDNMGTTALDYTALWQGAKLAFSDDRENQPPKYTPLPQDYNNNDNNTYYNEKPSAPPLLAADQFDVYGGMSQRLKDSCMPLLTSRKQPRSTVKNGGWIKRKRRLRSKKQTRFSCPLVPLPDDGMPDLESGIPLPGSDGCSSSRTQPLPAPPPASQSGLRRRKTHTYK